VFKKVLLSATLLIFGTGLGLFGGWELSSCRFARDHRAFEAAAGHDFVKSYETMARLKLLDAGTATRLQNPQKGTDQRREYLKMTLEATGKGREEVKDPRILTLINVETGIAYVRLAMLEEAAGNPSAARAWMEKAQVALQASGWRDCSEAHLRTVGQAMNKRDAI
jgi:hypothetical protein